MAGPFHFHDDGTGLGVTCGGCDRSMGGTFTWLLVIVWRHCGHPVCICWKDRPAALAERVGTGAMGHYARFDTPIVGNVSASIAGFTLRERHRDPFGQPDSGSVNATGCITSP